MKTSTKLLLIYGGLIVAGILTIYISTYFLKDKNLPWKGYDKIKVELSDFSVIHIQDSIECHVDFGDTCKIQWYQPQDSVQKGLDVQVRNDTLFIKQTSEKRVGGILLTVKQLSSVVATKKATVTLFEPIQNELNVQLDNATCLLYEVAEAKKALLSQTLHLTLQASNRSEINLNSPIKELTATLDSSELKVSGVFGRVTLTQQHQSSTLFYRSPLQLTMQRDSTSAFQVY